jgi:hypothetical protein
MFPSRPPTRSSTESGGVVRICSVGRLSYQKGFRRTASCSGKANRRLPPWTLTTLGTGPLAVDLQVQAVQEGIAERVSLPVCFLSEPMRSWQTQMFSYTQTAGKDSAWRCSKQLLSGCPSLRPTARAGHGKSSQVARAFSFLPGDVGQLADALVKVATGAGLRSRPAVQAKRRASAYAPVRVAEQLLDIANQL